MIQTLNIGYLLSLASNPMQDMKKYTILIALTSNHSDSEIAIISNVTRSFEFKIGKELLTNSVSLKTYFYRNVNTRFVQKLTGLS